MRRNVGFNLKMYIYLPKNARIDLGSEFQDCQMKCQENVQTAHVETMPEYMSDSVANYMSTGTSGKNFA